MRILFVAISESVHTARWIRQLSGQGWDVHLFPATDAPPHAALTDVTLHAFSRVRPKHADPGLRVTGPYPLRTGGYLSYLAARRAFPQRMASATRLASVVRRLKPDIIHSLGVQLAGYLTLDAKRVLGKDFPPWLVSCWGNDLYLFARLAEHAPKVKAVLAECDYFTADCERDNSLSRRYAFEGETFPALPVVGGFDIERVCKLRPALPPSQRRVIVLKGYQSWAGRALDGLRAIESCADVLRDYRVVVYLADDAVKMAAELMSQRTGIPVEIFPRSSYEETLAMHGRARISIGVSISDGVPLSTLEAALMGSFPIQTNTSCVDEWLRPDVGALLVPADDPNAVAAAIRRAIADDDLVDRAAEINFRDIAEHLNLERVGLQVRAMYQKIFAAGARKSPAA